MTETQSTLHKPLQGIRVVILRQEEQALSLMRTFQNLGADVISMPLLSFVGVKNALSILNEQFLKNFTAVCFTSTNTVRFFMKALICRKSLTNKKIYAVGLTTAVELKSYGIFKVHIGNEYSATGLLNSMPLNLHDETFLLPGSTLARDTLAQGLKLRGARVVVLSIYKPIELQPEEYPVLAGDWVVFTSPSMVENYFRMPQACDTAISALCIGPLTTLSLQSKNIVSPMNVHTAFEASKEGIVRYIVEYTNTKGSSNDVSRPSLSAL